MFDITKLDKNKQFIGLSFRDGLISDLIEVTQKGDESIIGDKTSHVLGVGFDTDDWYVWEAHLEYKGVRKIKLTEYIKEKLAADSVKIIFKEFELDVEVLNYYYNFKKYYPYDLKNIIFRLMDNFAALRGKGTKNLICSKFIAMAQKGFSLCYQLDIPYDEVTPAHCQVFTKHLPVAFFIYTPERREK